MLKLKLTGFKEAVAQLKAIPGRLRDEIGDELEAGALLIEGDAKDKAPTNYGHLKSSIGHVTNRAKLSTKVTVNANYAAYVEFGTGKYAAQYVATLPADWASYAATFKGKTGGDIDLFLEEMVKWVRRKGLHGLTKSGNVRRGKKANADAYNIAYVIVINILRNGIHPHPFLYPAFKENAPKIETALIAAVNRAIQ